MDPAKEFIWYKKIGTILIVCCILTGGFYSYIQWYYLAEVKDPFFTGILMASTTIAYQLLIHANGFFLKHAQNTKYKNRELLLETYKSVFAYKGCYGNGLLLGITFFFASYAVQIWSSQVEIQLMHCVFLFFVNWMIGAGVYSIFIYLKKSFNLGSKVEIGLYDRSCPLAIFLIRFNKRITYSVSIISALSLLSLLFGLYSWDTSIHIFTVWTLLIVIASLFVPMMGISQKVSDNKFDQLQKVSRLIDNNYKIMISKIENGENYKTQLEVVSDLSKAHKEIGKIKVYPPIGNSKSFQTALVAILITLIPTLIDQLLKILN